MKAPPNDLSGFGRHRPGPLLGALLGLTRGASGRWWGKRRAFFLRALGIAALRGRPVDAEVGGTRMRLYPARSNAEKNLLFTPQYVDREERAYLLANLTADFTFVDVGADVGGYALFVAAHAGDRARILAIEPQPDIFERLVYNIRENDFFTVKALGCAVADREGDVTLFVNPHNSGETSMRLVNAHARGRQVTVQAKALAALLAEEGFTRLDALKIDVEGAEDIILEPFFASVAPAAWPRILILEDAPTRWGVDLPSLVREHGYALALRTPMNLIFRRG